MDRIIMHVDVNNAFLSWTAVNLLKEGHHDIRKEYAVIGGDEAKRRGVVIAKSIKAKKLGIKTADTLYSARRKYKYLKVYSPNFKVYREMSNNLFKLIEKYTKDIEIVSIDECYIDYTKIKNKYGDELLFAYRLRNEIYRKLGFTVNIGIANNKLCAKMASDFTKPNKVHTLYDYEVKTKMWPLNVSELYGVGKSTSAKLKRININTIKDLASTSEDELYKYFKNQAKYLIRIANGIDDSEVTKEEFDPKCISNTMTLLYDYDDINEINKELLFISKNLSNELVTKQKYAGVVAIIIKNKYFQKTSHQIKLYNVTNDYNIIYENAKKLFKEKWDETPVRLIGIRLSDLTNNNDYQMSLFDNID